MALFGDSKTPSLLFVPHFFDKGIGCLISNFFYTLVYLSGTEAPFNDTPH